MELTHAPTYGKTFSICVVNGDPSKGTDTMLRCNLPVAFTYDGTSCFNFMKELVSRYYGEANPKVFRILIIFPDISHFPYFLYLCYFPYFPDFP